jgi:hypothetical protein
MLRIPDDGSLLMIAGAVFVSLDSVLIATSRTPTRTRLLGAATTGAFAAATTNALSE